jgi:hypothetical protein
MIWYDIVRGFKARGLGRHTSKILFLKIKIKIMLGLVLLNNFFSLLICKIINLNFIFFFVRYFIGPLKSYAMIKTNANNSWKKPSKIYDRKMYIWNGKFGWRIGLWSSGKKQHSLCERSWVLMLKVAIL